MKNDTKEWDSKFLGKTTRIDAFGHFGVSVLLFGLDNDDDKQTKKHNLINALSKNIDKGKVKIFYVDGLYDELWWQKEFDPHLVSKRHFEFNNFLIEEVIPFIYNHCGSPVPILSAGIGQGAYHAANTYFRRPDMFLGTIAIDGFFNLHELTRGYFDENCYFNSPIHYLPNLNDNYWYSYLLNARHIHLATSTLTGENVSRLECIDDLLKSKNIPHEAETWDMPDSPIDEVHSVILDKIISHRI